MKKINSKPIVKLVIFDLDGTITRSPNIWQHLHSELGTWKWAKNYAQKYQNGEISYEEWAKLDCSLWKGTKLERILQITSEIKYFDGATETIGQLKKAGIKVGIVSAGISFLAEKVGKDLNVDVVMSNDLKISNDVITGEIETNVSIDNKKSIIQDIAQSMFLTMSEVVVVGDHVFDLPREAGLKIAFNPRHTEAENAADFIVKGEDLTEVFKIIKANTKF
ncbi:MAG: HAD family phosphatase [Candidatus Bathyarchaeia archaeon]